MKDVQFKNAQRILTCRPQQIKDRRERFDVRALIQGPHSERVPSYLLNKDTPRVTQRRVSLFATNPFTSLIRCVDSKNCDFPVLEIRNVLGKRLGARF